MGTMTHEVEVDSSGNGEAEETTWVPCTVIGRRAYLSGGEDAYDVRTEDGREFRMCNPECVRVRS